MCTPDVDAQRPPLKPRSPAPPTAVKPCPSTATVRIRAADGTSEPCSLVVASKSIQLKAVGSKAGSCAWSTTSTKIQLENDSSDTVTLVGGEVTSDARNAEVVQLVFTPDGESPLLPVSIGVSVIRGLFEAAPDTKYGFDNMTAVYELADPHASVKEGDATRLHVRLEGGAELGDLKLVSDAADIATADHDPDPAAPAGTVLVTAGSIGHTTIRAVLAGEPTQEVMRVHADVYKESVYTFKVWRIWDSRSPPTALRRAVVDVDATERALQNTYKRAVLVGRVIDAGEGKPVDVPYDEARCGSLLFVPPQGGPAWSALRAAIRPAGTTATVSIGVVRSMRIFFPLARDAKKGETRVEIWSRIGTRHMDSVINPTKPGYTLSTGQGIPTAPTYNVVGIDGFFALLDRPLDEDHFVGEGLSQSMHGVSGDPQFMVEEVDDDEKKEVGSEMEAATMAHEGLHTIGGLRDVFEENNIMHFGATAGRDLCFHDTPQAARGAPAPDMPVQKQWDQVRRP